MLCMFSTSSRTSVEMEAWQLGLCVELWLCIPVSSVMALSSSVPIPALMNPMDTA